MVDSAMFYIVGTLYPDIVRSTYGALGFPQYPGEVGASDATPSEKEKAQQSAVEAAIGTDRRPSNYPRTRAGEPQATFDYLFEAGLPHRALVG